MHRWKTAQRTWKAQDKSNVVADLAGRGADKPLFINFRYEDWVLLNLRVELHLLMFALLNDTTACTRIDRLSFFYNKYFKKPLIPSNYGFQAYGELLDIIKDTVAITGEASVLAPQLEEDTDFSKFVTLTASHQHDRHRRVDAGEVSAVLNFAMF